jgi:hypothetical protein
LQWAAHWPAAGNINRWDTHVVLVVDLASDRGSIPRASTYGSSSNVQRRPEMGAVVRCSLCMADHRGAAQIPTAPMPGPSNLAI